MKVGTYQEPACRTIEIQVSESLLLEVSSNINSWNEENGNEYDF